MLYLNKGHALMFSAIHDGTDQFEYAQYNVRAHISFSSDVFFPWLEHQMMIISFKATYFF